MAEAFALLVMRFTSVVPRSLDSRGFTRHRDTLCIVYTSPQSSPV